MTDNAQPHNIQSPTAAHNVPNKPRNVKRNIRPTAAHTNDPGNKKPSISDSTTPSIDDYYGRSPDFTDLTSGTNVKAPTKNVLDLSEVDLTPETTADLLFYEIGGVELANLLTFNSVSGLNQQFKVISNIEELRLKYDPTRLLAAQATGNGGIKDFSINLFDKIPDQDWDDTHFFINIVGDSDVNMWLDLVLELDNIEDGDEVELQIITSGTIVELT